MNEAVSALLDKSRQSISAAELLLRDSYVDFSVSRTYYAMFYSIEALLLSRDLAFSKHSAAIAAFGKDFVKPGRFDAKFHRYILDAYDVRNIADYGTMHVISVEKAAELLTWAKELLCAVEEFLCKG